MMKQVGYCLLLFVGCTEPSRSPLLLSSKEASTKAFTDTIFGHHKACVFYFLTPDCPLCQSYVPIMDSLQKRFAAKDISFTAVFPGKEKMQSVESFQKEYSFKMNYILDSTLTITKYFSATVTPEVFFTEGNGGMLYHGRIDNWAFDIGRKRTLVTEHNLADALEAFVENKTVDIKSTKAVGCLIER